MDLSILKYLLFSFFRPQEKKKNLYLYMYISVLVCVCVYIYICQWSVRPD